MHLIFKILEKKLTVKNKKKRLQNEVEDRLLMKKSFFFFLVCAFHKEPIELTGFNRLYI